MTRARILFVEDDPSLSMVLGDALRNAGYEVLHASDGERGLELGLTADPALILLDLMLPKRDGLSVLKALREDRISAPVLILSARGEEWDRVVGFEYGADDYLTKPFSKRELLLRIETALTRAEGRVPGVGEPGRSARFGDVEVDFAAYSMTRAGVRYGLSRRELELLRYFIENEGQPLNRLAILDAVWGRDQDPTPRTVDMHVLKLRRKIEHDPEAPRHLMTIYGVGYRFLRRPE